MKSPKRTTTVVLWCRCPVWINFKNDILTMYHHLPSTCPGDALNAAPVPILHRLGRKFSHTVAASLPRRPPTAHRTASPPPTTQHPTTQQHTATTSFNVINKNHRQSDPSRPRKKAPHRQPLHLGRLDHQNIYQTGQPNHSLHQRRRR